MSLSSFVVFAHDVISVAMMRLTIYNRFTHYYEVETCEASTICAGTVRRWTHDSVVNFRGYGASCELSEYDESRIFNE